MLRALHYRQLLHTHSSSIKRRRRLGLYVMVGGVNCPSLKEICPLLACEKPDALRGWLLVRCCGVWPCVLLLTECRIHSMPHHAMRALAAEITLAVLVLIMLVVFVL